MELDGTAAGSVNWYDYFRKPLAVPSTAEHKLVLSPAIPSQVCLKRNASVHPSKDQERL